MAVFPDYAKIFIEGYGEELDFGVLRTEMDGALQSSVPDGRSLS